MVLKILKIVSGSVRINFFFYFYVYIYVEVMVIVIKIYYIWVIDGNLVLEDGCFVKLFNEIN